MNPEIAVIHEKVKEQSAFVERLCFEIGNVIVGQKYMIERLMIAMLTGGHILLEGVPGLAKTLAVKTLAKAIDAKFQRIQSHRGDEVIDERLATLLIGFPDFLHNKFPSTQ